MSIHQLEALWPTQSLNHKKLWRSWKRQLRSLIKRQYYITNALADSQLALQKSEDLVLACLILIGCISFASFSVLANAVYIFALAGAGLATAIHFNLAFLVLIAFGVMAIAYTWVATFLQGLLAYALYDSAAAHPKRSLRRTLRRSLSSTTKATTAWALLLGVTIVPPAAIGLATVIVAHLIHLKIAAMLPYLIGMGLVSLAWMAFVLMNYSLMPYVTLFEHGYSGWQTAAERARNLARRKGRVFAISFYLTYLAGAVLMYGLALILQAITSVDSIFFFVLFNMAMLTAGNAALTMYYRKCRLSRA